MKYKLFLTKLFGVVVFCAFSSLLNATITVNLIVGDFLEGPHTLFADADGEALPAGAGSQVWIGYFDTAATYNEDDFSSVIGHFSNLRGDGEAAGTIWAEGSGTNEDRPAGGVQASAPNDGNTESFDNKNIFVMVTLTGDGTALEADNSNLIQYGIFSSNRRDTGFDWIFPTTGSYDIFGDEMNEVIIGGSSIATVENNLYGTVPQYFTLITPTIVPEPSTYAAIFGLLTLAFVALRRRRT
jgi:hypothetical protein